MISDRGENADPKRSAKSLAGGMFDMFMFSISNSGNCVEGEHAVPPGVLSQDGGVGKGLMSCEVNKGLPASVPRDVVTDAALVVLVVASVPWKRSKSSDEGDVDDPPDKLRLPS